MLSCREVVAHSSALLDGELTGLARLRVRFHLLMCHRCRGFLDSLSRLRRTLPELAEQEEDSEAVERIAKQVTGRIATRFEQTGARNSGATEPTGETGTGDRHEP